MAKEKCKKCAFYRGIIKDLLTLVAAMYSDEGEGPSLEEVHSTLQRFITLLLQLGPSMQ